VLKNHHIVIIANSGRMIAQMAKKSGYNVIVIDCFSDTDTQAFSVECIKVDSLALEHIKPAISILQSRFGLLFAIIGSGFECYLPSLNYLHQKFKVLGNKPNVFSAVQNKLHFFSTLEQLKIPYPETSFQRPELKDGWLVKPMQGEGGKGIKKIKGLMKKNESCYWQRFIDGMPLSILFIANSTNFTVCGFHKQQVTSISNNEFIFSGIISYLEISDEIKRQLNSWVSSLVKAFGLIGLNSVDFMLENNQCYVLEVNPRPSASMQLYSSELIDGHIKSCLNKLLDIKINLGEYSAYQIIFAETNLIIKKNIQWPKWTADIPQEGVLINTGMPICSIIARGKSEQQVLDKLLLRQQLVKKLIK
jgi:methenyltetrahydromethanopterin cyclohydrolase